jgi:biopolymer transport protein ExbB/TolQ
MDLVRVAQIAASVVLYVLIGLSVLSAAVILDRWWYFRKRRTDIDSLGRKLDELLRQGDPTDALALLATERSVEAEVLRDAFAWFGQGPEAFEQILVKGVRLRRKSFEGGLLFLGTLGNNAPFIGLFGTVLGIITAFHGLGSGNASAMGNVMTSIAEALLATAIGILVALPAVIAYNIFQKKGSDIEENSAALGNIVLARMKAHGDASAHALHGSREGAEGAVGKRRISGLEA